MVISPIILLRKIVLSCNILILWDIHIGIFVALKLGMKPFRKDMLRESIKTCKQSSLYYCFTREERRAAVMHVYSIINESQLGDEEAFRNSGELASALIQT